MSGLGLKRFTAFAWGHDNVAPAVWVNPAQIAYVQARIVTRGHDETADGTLLYFQQEAGVLEGRDYDRELKLDLTYEAARADLVP